MKISAKTQYAALALLELAARYETGDPARVREIAAAHAIPARFLVQILLQLKAAGLVASVRGAAGGYQLIRPPEEVTLAAVKSAMEGGSEPPGGEAGQASPQARALSDVWQEAAEAQRELLAGVTLADLLERAEASQPMYYI
ncbi:MAG: Rrf2 family transcriptional regulator [Planctomycetales bacterium]|nr:Rrf2 family transcriptional regulator [Planctomycetales bacterium]